MQLEQEKVGSLRSVWRLWFRRLSYSTVVLFNDFGFRDSEVERAQVRSMQLETEKLGS